MKTFSLISIAGQEAVWYLVVKQGDFLSALEACDEAANTYIRNWVRDPHTDAALQRGEVDAIARHPANCLGKKALVILDRINESAICFNRNGGWCVPHKGAVVMQTVEQEQWPAPRMTGYRVTIGRWPGGTHFYVDFHPAGIVMPEPKYNSFEEAKAAVEKLVPGVPITTTQNFGYRIEGD